MLNQVLVQKKEHQPAQKRTPQPKLKAAHVQQQKEPLLKLQRYLGGKRLQRMAICQPGDAYELEAERVADKVMRMPAPELQQGST